VEVLKLWLFVVQEIQTLEVVGSAHQCGSSSEDCEENASNSALLRCARAESGYVNFLSRGLYYVQKLPYVCLLT